ELVVRPHQSVQMHRFARWHVQRGVGVWHDRGAVVSELGIWRSAMEKTGCLSEMVAARIRGKFQDADPRRARPERLSDRCFARIRSLHDAANTAGAVQNVVFSGRRPLGAKAAEQPALVQDGERLGGSMVQEVNLL